MTEVTNRPLVDSVGSPIGVPAPAVERRLADARDSGFLRDLFAESRDDLCLLPSDTRDVIVDMQFRAQRRAWRCEHPAARQEVLLVRGVRAGHVLIAADLATVHVVDLAVRPGLRGLGIGSAVLADVFADADRTHRAVRGRIWSSNHAARRFAVRAGFAPGATLAGYQELFRAPTE